MKIVLDMKEVETILADYLLGKGQLVKTNSFDRISHFVGQYDDQQEIIDGFQFEIEGGV